LRKELESIDRVLSEKLTARGVAPAGGPAGPVPEANGEGAPGARVDGEIRNRDDVTRTLDRLCDYFRKHEPSSPVPLLLQRAKSLVAKDFLAILRELTPDGVAQAEVIVGVEKKEE
jgi:type VI secretion system protein ImpA